MARDESHEGGGGGSGTACTTGDHWWEFACWRGRQREVRLGASVGVVPACLPGGNGEFFGARFLKGDGVGLLVARWPGGCGVCSGEVDAAADARDRGLGGAPFKLDLGSRGGEGLSQ